MLEFIAGVEGFRTGRRVEAGLDQTGWANGHVRSIQDVGNLARAGGVGEDGRSESDRDGANINTFFQLPGQRGPHDRTIRDVTPTVVPDRRLAGDWVSRLSLAAVALMTLRARTGPLDVVTRKRSPSNAMERMGRTTGS